MKNCEDIRRRLNFYLDNELLGEDRVAVETHLRECQSCAVIFEREQSFINAIRECGPLHVASPALRARVRETVSGSEREATNAPEVSRSRLTWGLAIAAAMLVLLVPIVIWRTMSRSDKPTASSFALMAADHHLRRTRGQLPLEVETAAPREISDWFANKVHFSVKLPNYQESSGQERLYELEGARLVGYKDDYAAYVAYLMKQRPISLLTTPIQSSNPWVGKKMSRAA